MQPNAEMSSCQATFDLTAAREALSRATERPNVATDIYHLAALTYLPAALDEIERLQAEQSDFKYKFLTMFIGKLCSKHAGDNTLPLPEFERLCHEHCFFCLIEKNQEQAKRIAELESENENLREWGISNASDAAREKVRTEKQLAALKKLGQVKRERGKALVEERAQWNAICRDVGADPSDRYCTGEGDDGYPEAREQLRREGKL